MVARERPQKDFLRPRTGPVQHFDFKRGRDVCDVLNNPESISADGRRKLKFLDSILNMS